MLPHGQDARGSPALQDRNEFVWRYVGLSQDTCQRADFDFVLHGNDTAFGTTAQDEQDDMASGLAKPLEAQTLQGSYHGSARNMWQLRAVSSLV